MRDLNVDLFCLGCFFCQFLGKRWEICWWYLGLSRFVIWWQQGGLFANLFSSFQQFVTHCFHLFLGNLGRNGRGWNFDYYFKTGMRLHTPPHPGFGTGMRFVLNKRDGVGMRATRPEPVPLPFLGSTRMLSTLSMTAPSNNTNKKTLPCQNIEIQKNNREKKLIMIYIYIYIYTHEPPLMSRI